MTQLSSNQLDDRKKTVVDDYEGIIPYAEIFYVLSIEYSARSAVSCFMEFGQECSKPGDPASKVAMIHDALNHCAALSRFFWPPSKGKLAKARAMKLRKLFEVEENSPLKNRSLRNDLEHFDERLDEYMLNDVVGMIIPTPMIAPIAWLEDDPTAKIFKMVDPETEIFVLLNKKFHFGPIAKEAARVLLASEQIS